MNKKIALAGVPNCGKTTFWNLSTGKSGKTGNWPGVTAKKLSAPLADFPETELIDIPGTYSLSGNSLEEIAAENFLKSGEADSLIILLDGTNPEPGLFFAMELLSLKIPAVIGINFSDELEKQGTFVDIKKLESFLGVSVFLISAFKNKNTKPLILAAKNNFLKNPFPKLSYENRRKKAALLSSECFSKNSAYENKKSFLILFSFFVLSATVLSISNLLKTFSESFFEHFTAAVSAFLNYISAPAILRPLFAEGIIPGISAVCSFLPELTSIFLILSFLESSGYMARIAFLFDYLFKKIGFSGKSAIPVLIGFGCTVPAIYAAKSSENEHESSNVLSFLMFVPCSARLPLAFLICEAFFPVLKKTSVVFLYLITLLIGIIYSFLKKREPSAFVLELPKIRIPSAKSILKTCFIRTWFFIEKASLNVVLVSVLLFVLKNFDFTLRRTELFSESAIFSLGSLIYPFFIPTGIPFEGVVSLFFGFFAKEASLFALFSLCENPHEVFSPISAVSFLLFYFICSPCSSALIAIKNEFGLKKAARLFLRQTAFAYFVSFSFFQLATLIKNLFIP